MKIAICSIFGFILGLALMYLIRPVIWPPPVEIKILKETVYKTRWKVKKEISIEKANQCVFSPIEITAKTKDDTMQVTAKDECKEAKKDFKIGKEESYLDKALLGAGALGVGLAGGIILSK